MAATAGGAPVVGLDSDAVTLTARQVGCHADDVRATHNSTQAALDAGLYGCVGRSGDELAALSQRWVAIGQRHSERLDELSRHASMAGVELTETDQANADRVDRVNDVSTSLPRTCKSRSIISPPERPGHSVTSPGT
jgi:hypothetical protein